MQGRVRLHVDRQGSGRDLLLVHGWGLHSKVWRGVQPALAARFRLHTVDLPGYGASRSVPVRGFDEAIGMLDESLPDDAVVCGWSLGALLAIALAHRTTRRVRALALVSATPCFVARPGWDHGMDAETFDAFAAGAAGDREATLARFMRLAALGAASGREAARELASCLGEAPLPTSETLGATLQWLRDIDLRPVAAQVKLPTIAIHGEGDAVTTPEAGRWLATHLAHARFIGVPRGAHVPFITHPAEFVAALESADG